MAPPNTTLEQLSTNTTLSDGTQRFEVLSTLSFVKDGDLPGPAGSPYREVFVYQVTIPNNPKDDQFLRVARISDLTTLPRSRQRALDTGSKLFLSATCTIAYPRLDQAVDAKKIVQARLDDLIAQWHLYTEQFISPDEFELPLIAPSIVRAAKEDYKAARDARATADEAAEDAVVARDAAQAAATRANTALTLAYDHDAHGAAIKSLVDAAVLATTNGPALQDAINVHFANQVTQKTLDKAAADAALSAATTDLVTKQGLATKAAADEATALAHVLDVCPDFDPDSV